MNVPRALELIAQRSPDALMFGSDMPSTRSKRPFQGSDIELIKSILGHDLARKALWSNGRSVYRLSETHHHESWPAADLADARMLLGQLPGPN